MAARQLSNFPRPLLADLVAGRWLPILGAGLSRNAIVPDGTSIPMWAELGDLIGQDLQDYSSTGPIDALSAFEHEFGRPKLIERLSELLRVDVARPSDTHKAFCSLPFDLVCTTNFDFLLEHQYQLILRHCTPLFDEDQLSIGLTPRSHKTCGVKRESRRNTPVELRARRRPLEYTGGVIQS